MRHLLRTALMVIALISLTSCSFGYLFKQGMRQMNLYSKRVPVSKVLSDPNVSEEIKSKLQFAQLVREFAEEKLGLKKTKNYTTYLPLKTDYVSYAVTAAERTSMTQFLWRFPIVGAIPYKGFFDVGDAKREVEKLKNKGLDTYIRGVSAYSTLGWFADPLTTPLLTRLSDASLAELIIHELTHSTIYLANQGSFNETLADFVGEEGCRMFLAEHFGKSSSELRRYEGAKRDSEKWNKFIQESVEELRQFYAAHKDDPEIIDKREKKFDELKRALMRRVIPNVTARKFYEGYVEIPWNNAFLLSYLTYSTNPELFEELYSGLGKDFPKFISKIKEVEDRPSEESPFDTLKRFIDTQK
ncbi:aminopeptidase [Bdellovibrionota bacterium]